jgi:3-methyl-2-oxobutanoate hydroxymethyltransferase
VKWNVAKIFRALTVFRRARFLFAAICSEDEGGNMERKKVTLPEIQRKKEMGEPITMLTAYDVNIARAVDEAGIDMILVGDSYGMVMLGYDTTVPVTMDQMITAAQAVARGAKNPLLIGDLPFLSYQVNAEEAIRNAGRFVKEANMDAVKLEGGREIAPTVRAITNAGIAVMGHVGLTPQSVSKLGGWRTQGTTAEAAHKLLDDARALQDAGCFAIVLEKVPERLADLVTQHLQIPTIGIGAGAHCDGQVLVTNDVLGLFDRFVPKFAKQYAKLYPLIVQALGEYKRDVDTRAFPAAEHAFGIKDAEWDAFLKLLQADDAPSSRLVYDESADAARVYG